MKKKNVETLLEHTDKLLLSSTSSDYSLLLQSQVRHLSQAMTKQLFLQSQMSHLSQAMTKQPGQAACLQ